MIWYALLSMTQHSDHTHLLAKHNSGTSALNYEFHGPHMSHLCLPTLKNTAPLWTTRVIKYWHTLWSVWLHDYFSVAYGIRKNRICRFTLTTFFSKLLLFSSQVSPESSLCWSSAAGKGQSADTLSMSTSYDSPDGRVERSLNMLNSVTKNAAV